MNLQFPKSFNQRNAKQYLLKGLPVFKTEQTITIIIKQRKHLCISYKIPIGIILLYLLRKIFRKYTRKCTRLICIDNERKTKQIIVSV